MGRHFWVFSFDCVCFHRSVACCGRGHAVVAVSLILGRKLQTGMLASLWRRVFALMPDLDAE